MLISPKEEYQNLTYGSQKKLLAQCDMCQVEYTTMYRNYIRSQKRKNNTGKTLCSKCAVKNSNRKRGGNGKNEYLSLDGYKMIRNGKKKSDVGGWGMYSKEHKVLMEAYIGRSLTQEEVIHHIDFDKLNNDINNLHLFKSGREHRNAHVSLENIGLKLFLLDLVVFDRDKGLYVITNKLETLLRNTSDIS